MKEKERRNYEASWGEAGPWSSVKEGRQSDGGVSGGIGGRRGWPLPEPISEV